MTAGVGAGGGELGPGELHQLVGTGRAEAVRPSAGDHPQVPRGREGNVAPPVEEIVTVGVGFAGASSARELDQQPCGQAVETRSSPTGRRRGQRRRRNGSAGKSEIVVWGVGEPDLANCHLVYS